MSEWTVTGRPAGRLGVMVDRDSPPETLVEFCRALEASGVDDVWVVEDLGWAGSTAAAATALATTRRLRVGIGIAPAPLRNPALLAMEFATLARLHPGRLAAGVGHGVAEWMAQVGATVPSPLALLEETISVVRALLRGESVTFQGRAVQLDRVRLVHPPVDPPPVLAGVTRPRSLALSGRVADGTILIEGTSPRQVARARQLVARGTTEHAPGGAHELVVLTHLLVEEDPDKVAEATTPVLAELADFLAVPTEELFATVGSLPTIAERVRSLWDAGADTVVWHVVGDNHIGQVEHALRALGRS